MHPRCNVGYSRGVQPDHYLGWRIGEGYRLNRHPSGNVSSMPLPCAGSNPGSVSSDRPRLHGEPIGRELRGPRPSLAPRFASRRSREPSWPTQCRPCGKGRPGLPRPPVVFRNVRGRPTRIRLYGSLDMALRGDAAPSDPACAATACGPRFRAGLRGSEGTGSATGGHGHLSVLALPSPVSPGGRQVRTHPRAGRS